MSTHVLREQIQARMSNFGSAMLGAVLLFPFLAFVISLCIVLKMTFTDGFIYDVLIMIETAGWTVFNNMALLFAVGIPIKLATHANAQACLVSLLTYLIFNTILGYLCSTWGGVFGVDFSQNTGGTSGLALLNGIKTLDTSIIGAIVVGSVVTAIHNKYFDKKLPEYLGIFQGASFVSIVSFLYMFPLALIFALIFPSIQDGMISLQSVILNTGNFGVWLYIFLEKILLPTGLHHFIYSPFQYADVVVQGGTMKFWLENLHEFSQSTIPLKELFPMGGFTMQGNGAVFGGLGMAAAIYACASRENRIKVAGVIIPAAITSMFLGITEPLDFTFLFIAPVLFLIHAILSATMTVVMYSFGVVGNFGSGLLEWTTQNWIPMFSNHASNMFIQLLIGLGFSCIYFFIFKFMILKFDFKTLGRGKASEKLYTKEDYKNKQTDRSDVAKQYLDAVGGKDNVLTVSHCLTRLRLTVKDGSLIQSTDEFNEIGAKGLNHSGTNVQIIIGIGEVGNVYEEFKLLVQH